MKTKALLFLWLCAAAPFSAIAQTNRIVSPTGFEQTPGNTADEALAGAVTQQLYRGSSLDAILPSPVQITGVAFRVPEASFGGFNATLSSVEFRMSTSARTPETMSLDYSQNKGVDETIVFQHGNVSLFSRVASPVNPFDLRFTFDTPFAYDPKAGSLLFYMVVGKNGGGANGVEAQAYQNRTISPGAVVHGSSPFETGPSPVEIITEFTYVAIPEPGTLWLVAAGVAAILARRTILAKGVVAL